MKKPEFSPFLTIGTAALTVIVGGAWLYRRRDEHTHRPSIEIYGHVLGPDPTYTQVQPSSNARMLTTHRKASSSGKREATLVFLHGFGCNSLEFKDVIHLIQTRHTDADIFTYDRILFVENSLDLPLDRTEKQLAQELHHILETRNIPGPYILVGHSYGGLVAQIFAAQYANIVRGAVLIDPSSPQQFDHLPTDFAAVFLYIVPAILKTYSYVAWTGLLKLMDYGNAFAFPPLYLWPRSSPYRAAARQLYSDNDVWRLTHRELMGAFAGAKSQEAPPIPTCPIGLVIAANRKNSPTLFPQAVTDTFIKLHQPLWKPERNKLFLGKNSDHWVHMTEPELVLEALDHVLSSM